MHRVLVSATFARTFQVLPATTQERIRDGLNALSEDPRTPRPGVDIKPLAATDPLKYRLRVGRYRVASVIEKRVVKVLDVFQRGRGYRE
jgi:mRNA-degrading endonuclease RelE of RelBE toxin-antitoxin system